MLVIGHRGASRAESENTPAAFRRAAEQGADGVELDVRLAPGDRLVVHHNPLPGDPEAIDELPTFAQSLDACAGLLVNVEVKNNEGDPDFDPTMAVVEPVLSELLGRAAPANWLISSFSAATVDRCRSLAPELATALLVIEASERLVDEVAAAGHLALHPWVGNVSAELVGWCHSRGLAVNTWTCNDPQRIRELADLGVDGVCTGVPDLALAALGRDAGVPVSSSRPAWGRPA
jgi:glycerophosphoryl diester phosphodiesterase